MTGRRGHPDDVPLWMEVVATRGGLFLLILGVTGAAGVLSGELGPVAQVVVGGVLAVVAIAGFVVHVRRVQRDRSARRAAGGPPGFLDEFRQAVDAERGPHTVPQVGRDTVASPEPPVSNEGAQDE